MNKAFGIVMMLLSMLIGAQIFAQSGISHLRERVLYVDASGIIGQSGDVRAQIGDSAASNFAWGMRKIVVHEGRFYHVFTDRSEGGDHDVYLRISADGIQWGNKIRVSDDSLDANQLYPTIAVHGSGSNMRIVVAWADYRTANPQMRATVSADGGQTWGASIPISNHTDNSQINGNVTVGPEGTFYAAWMRRYSGDRWDDTFFSKSADGGLTWTTPVTAFDGHHYSGPSQIVAGDSGKIFIVIDDDQFYRRNLVLRYSLDFGNTWHTGTQLTNYSTNEGTYVPSMQVESDSLYVLHKYYNNNTNFSRFDFMKSTDAGFAWSVPVQVNDSLIIDDNTNPGYQRFYPCIAVAPGGQRIYAVWADRRENPSQQEYNVYFSFSLDGGQTWSPDVRVNEDTSGTYQHYPSVAVKSDGNIDTVLVVWQDDRQTLLGVVAQPGSTPTGFQLHQNYPNPFNPVTTIAFALPSTQWVTLKVYDLLGREVKTLLSGRLTSGHYEAHWNGTDNAGQSVASGVYLYRLTAGQFVQTRKMILMR